jgi:hypothetical protein
VTDDGMQHVAGFDVAGNGVSERALLVEHGGTVTATARLP